MSNKNSKRFYENIQTSSWFTYLLGNLAMYQTKRFGLVASKQEYLMLCRAEHTRKRLAKKKPTGQRLSAFKVHKNIKHSIFL